MTSKSERDRYQEMRIQSDEGSETGSMKGDLAKLQQLLDLLKAGSDLRYSGSPASVVLQGFSDISALFSEIFLKARPFWTKPKNSPGLKFVESLMVPGDQSLKISQVPRPQQATPSQMKRIGTRGSSWTQVSGDFSGTSRDRFGVPDSRSKQILVTPLSKDYDKDVHYDPLTKTDYVYSDDSLGNPLQVSIDLDSPAISWGKDDRATLIQFFDELDQFFILLSTGKIDYRFVRALRRSMTERTSIKPASPSTPDETHKNRNIRSYYKRKRTPGVPKGGKQ